MLPKKERLNLKENSITGGAVFSCPWFRVKARRTPLQISRYGIVLGASVSKSAVKKNFLKRRIAEEIKKSSAALASAEPASYDMILIVSPHIAAVPRQRLGQELQASLRAARAFFERLDVIPAPATPERKRGEKAGIQNLDPRVKLEDDRKK